jgi:hypothetical protein
MRVWEGSLFYTKYMQDVYLHPFQQVSLVPLLCKIVETKANDTLEVWNHSYVDFIKKSLSFTKA